MIPPTPIFSIFCHVDTFQNWYKEHYTDGQIVAGETDDTLYPHWEDLKNVFSQLLATEQISHLSRDTKVMVLYLIARDVNHAPLLSWNTEGKPFTTLGDLTDEDFIDLVRVAATLTASEYEDAKAVLAFCVEKLGYLTPEIENILLQWIDCEDSITKIGAIISLAKLNYQGMAALVEKLLTTTLKPDAFEDAMVKWELFGMLKGYYKGPVPINQPSPEQALFAETVLEIIGSAVEQFGFIKHQAKVERVFTRITFRKDDCYIEISGSTHPHDYPFHYSISLGDDKHNSVYLSRLKGKTDPAAERVASAFPYGDNVQISIANASGELLKYADTFLRGDLTLFYKACSEKK